MAQIDYIKDLYENEDLSLREISRRTGHSFQTVQKYAYQENWSVERLPNLEAENYPSLEKYIPSIDEWMELDRKLPRKQRHTATRIYRRLVEEQGYQGSYSSVKRYVRKKKFVLKLATEGYLPLAQPCGHGQVDFGESLYYDTQGKECKGYALTVSFPQSNKGYTQFFPSQNQECLLEGLKRVFEHIGGVPPRLRFDNLSTAVVKVLEGGERELTDGFRRFMLHYRFQAEFCNPASGNEKGNVENKVGYSRRNAFVPVPTVISFEEFNEWLWEWCEKDAQRLLDEIVRDGNASVCEDALSLAAENGRTDPDSIRQCYYMIAKKEFRPRPLELRAPTPKLRYDPNLTAKEFRPRPLELRAPTPKLRYDPNLTAYDGLTGGASHA